MNQNDSVQKGTKKKESLDGIRRKGSELVAKYLNEILLTIVNYKKRVCLQGQT